MRKIKIYFLNKQSIHFFTSHFLMTSSLPSLYYPLPRLSIQVTTFESLVEWGKFVESHGYRTNALSASP